MVVTDEASLRQDSLRQNSLKYEVKVVFNFITTEHLIVLYSLISIGFIQLENISRHFFFISVVEQDCTDSGGTHIWNTGNQMDQLCFFPVPTVVASLECRQYYTET